MSTHAVRDCTVVICDDTSGIRLLLREMLGSVPAVRVVGEAGNGRDAVELAGKHAPDVMVLDISMPVMDGIEAIPLIHEASPHTSIVVLSGFSSQQVKDRALAAGAAEYVEKGLDPAAIIDAVKRHGACS